MTIINSEDLDTLFELLPPDIQRSLIDYALKEKTTSLQYDGKVYHIPLMIQLTYFCKKDAQSYPIRLYTEDVMSNGYASSIHCPECGESINVYHKTVPLDYALIKTGSKKGLSDFFIDS